MTTDARSAAVRLGPPTLFLRQVSDNVVVLCVVIWLYVIITWRR